MTFHEAIARIPVGFAHIPRDVLEIVLFLILVVAVSRIWERITGGPR